MNAKWIQTTLAAVCALGTACAGHVDQRVEGDDSSSERVTQSTSFSLSKDDALMDEARQAAAAGDYARAESAYDTVYRNAGAKAEKRAQALFLRGSVQANVLNPKRDVAAALASYEALVAEFPKSEWRDDAEQAMTSLRRTQNK
jgi:outer membrane protein assembly factor BamD (BamD/ComL family)